MVYKSLKLKVYAEGKDQTTGKSTWRSSPHTTAEVNVEDVSVMTSAERMVQKEGSEPKIIPFGVKGDKGRVATLTCTFKNRSMDSGTAMSSDPYLDVIQQNIEGELGYAIQAITYGTGVNPLPELGSAKWRIEQFAWDRQARQMGQWRFSMQLGYLWETPNELQLFDKTTNWSSPENIKFSAVVGITKTSYDKTKLISNPKINTTVQQLNTATFTTLDKVYDKNDIIHIYCQTDKSNAIFFGIIKDIRKNSNLTFTYECIEIGTLLDRVMCSKIGGGLFKPRTRIPNPYKGEDLKLRAMIATIMKFYEDSALLGYHPGYGVDMTTNNSGEWYPVGTKTTIPGKDVRLPSLVLSGNTVYKAINRLVEDICGMYTWFNNNTGALEYGYLRNLVTIDPAKDYITMSEESSSYTEDFAPNNVQVCDNNAQQYQIYPNPPVPGSTIQYKYNSDLNDGMLTEMAKRIHADLNVANNKSYKVRFPAGTVKFRDGDVFTGLGDATISPVMQYREGDDDDPLGTPKDAVWQIKEMTITNEYTEVLVGPSYFSVFDLYKTALAKVSETPAPTESKDIETNEIVAYTQDAVIEHTLE